MLHLECLRVSETEAEVNCTGPTSSTELRCVYFCSKDWLAVITDMNPALMFSFSFT